jgi:hypothetical protein
VETIKDFAERKNVSYEAIRKQVKRYSGELKGHVIKKGRLQYLDEVAIEFLESKRNESQVVIKEFSRSEEIQRLQQDKELLLVKVAELQDLLLREKDQVKQLQQDKILLLENSETKKRTWWQRITQP